MKKIFVFFSALVFLSQVLPVAAQEQQTKTQSFAQWCQQKNSLPKTTRLTIDALLKTSGTTNCQLSDSKLRSLTFLDLSVIRGDDEVVIYTSEGKCKPLYDLGPQVRSRKLSDLRPLAGLSNLTALSLSGNKISDLRPLAGLSNLTDLNLSFNREDSDCVKGDKPLDIKPLALLSRLTILNLAGNKISDVKPLALLNQLNILILSFNEISDVKPLAGLNKLGALFLSYNKISVKNCPVKPESICYYRESGN